MLERYTGRIEWHKSGGGYIHHDVNHEGEWVKADEAEAEIQGLKNDYEQMRDSFDSLWQDYYNGAVPEIARLKAELKQARECLNIEKASSESGLDVASEEWLKRQEERG